RESSICPRGRRSVILERSGHTRAPVGVGAGMRAVQYDEYGGIDVLHVGDVPVPQPGPGEGLVEVKAAGTNPGEAYVREGRYAERWPSTFPSGQGSDYAGIVSAVGD